MRISGQLRELSMKLNPGLYAPFWDSMGKLWTDLSLEWSLVELLRIKSATMIGCRR